MMQPFSRSTTLRMVARSNSTGAITSIVSAVPAGEVIARDEVLGIVRPKAVTIGTTIRVVLFPGRPPIQCLSTTNGEDHVSLVPTSIIDWVKLKISFLFNRASPDAAKKADIWISDNEPSTTSLTISLISSLFSS